MRKMSRFVSSAAGVAAPTSWGRSPTRLALAGVLALVAVGCGSKDETRSLQPKQLGMSSDMAAVYDDGQMQTYEVKLPVPFPVIAPTSAELAGLQGNAVEPYGRQPWVLKSDVQYQITWTLSNLDPDTHNVELLVDPWNEFGMYWPGMAVTNAQRQEQSPNLSGIDILMEVPGTTRGAASRRFGTFTVQDMDELAIDFATVLEIIKSVPPPVPGSNATDNPAIGLVNHAFARENRSYKDPLVAKYIPKVIAGLTGITLGMRTYEPANVAIEIVVEVVDKGSGKVVQRDQSYAIIAPPTNFVTVANGG